MAEALTLLLFLLSWWIALPTALTLVLFALTSVALLYWYERFSVQIMSTRWHRWWYLPVAALPFLPDVVAAALWSLMLIWLATGAAQWLARAVNHPSELLVILLTGAVADLVSLFAHGPTAKAAAALESYYTAPAEVSRPLVDYLMVKVPLWGQGVAVPLFSVIDWLFVALVLAIAQRVKCREALQCGVVSWPLIGLVAGVILAQSTGVFIPGIPCIALFSLVPLYLKEPRMRQLTAQTRTLTFTVPPLTALMGLLLLWNTAA